MKSLREGDHRWKKVPKNWLCWTFLRAGAAHHNSPGCQEQQICQHRPQIAKKIMPPCSSTSTQAPKHTLPETSCSSTLQQRPSSKAHTATHLHLTAPAPRLQSTRAPLPILEVRTPNSSRYLGQEKTSNYSWFVKQCYTAQYTKHVAASCHTPTAVETKEACLSLQICPCTTRLRACCMYRKKAPIPPTSALQIEGRFVVDDFRHHGTKRCQQDKAKHIPVLLEMG